MDLNKLEQKRWLKRVWRPEIKYNGTSENKKLKDIMTNPEMQAICFETVEDLYKFLDFGITKDIIRNNEVTFIRGDIFNIYIVTEYRYVDDCYKYIKELISDHLSDCKNKWIVCENLDTEFDFSSAGYLISKLSSIGCKGILYHMTEDKETNNLYECIKRKNYCKNIFMTDGDLLLSEKEEI